MRSAPESSTVPFVGLTGSVAAGKTEALRAFARHGAATLSADAVVHELLAGERMRELLVERWGDQVAPGGSVDRSVIGAKVFEQPEELAWLESVLHPLVAERIVSWRAGLDESTPLAVVEVPLLFETGMEAAFDATVAIVAPDGVRAQRAGARGTSELAGRERRQLAPTEKASMATYAIANDGSLEDLDRKVREVVAQIAAGARG